MNVSLEVGHVYVLARARSNNSHPFNGNPLRYDLDIVQRYDPSFHFSIVLILDELEALDDRELTIAPPRRANVLLLEHGLISRMRFYPDRKWMEVR